jgi:hypothetical protein
MLAPLDVLTLLLQVEMEVVLAPSGQMAVDVADDQHECQDGDRAGSHSKRDVDQYATGDQRGGEGQHVELRSARLDVRTEALGRRLHATA